MRHRSTTRKARLVMWIEDLELLASFCTARFIVWRALRHEREPNQTLGRGKIHVTNVLSSGPHRT